MLCVWKCVCEGVSVCKYVCGNVLFTLLGEVTRHWFSRNTQRGMNSHSGHTDAHALMHWHRHTKRDGKKTPQSHYTTSNTHTLSHKHCVTFHVWASCCCRLLFWKSANSPCWHSWTLTDFTCSCPYSFSGELLWPTVDSRACYSKQCSGVFGPVCRTTPDSQVSVCRFCKSALVLSLAIFSLWTLAYFLAVLYVPFGFVLSLISVDSGFWPKPWIISELWVFELFWISGTPD